MQTDEACLKQLERGLRYRLAAGEFGRWLETTDSVFQTPPWYSLGLEIVRLRLRVRGGELADLARQLIRDELRDIESRLVHRREQASCGDEIEYKFSKIRQTISDSDRSGASISENFVAFVLNAPVEDAEVRKPVPLRSLGHGSGSLGSPCRSPRRIRSRVASTRAR